MSDLVIAQGDDRPLTWDLTDKDGNPVDDLSGYTARAQVRSRPSSTAVLHEWSTTTGTAVFGDSTVSLTVDDSDTWTWRYGFYDLHITNPAAQTERVDGGQVVVTPAVTR